MRVAAFQFDVRRDDLPANVARVEEGLRAASADGIQLVVLPEMWPTSFASPVDEAERERLVRASEEAVAHVGALSAELGLMVAGSAFGRAPLSPQPCNRLTVFERGEVRLVYDKLHLFSPTAECEVFSAGDGLPATVATRLGSLSGVVCYDLRFAPCLRGPYREAAEWLVVPAQWPGSRASHWRALVVGRAAEHQAFVVAANRTGTDVVGRRRLALEFSGNSLIVGPDGVVRAEGRGEEGLVTADLDLEEVRVLRRRVPVRRDQRLDLYS
jgi:omega-amidase